MLVYIKMFNAITTIIEMETKLVQGRKATYFAGRKLLKYKFLKNILNSGFDKKSRNTLKNVFPETGQEDMNIIEWDVNLEE